MSGTKVGSNEALGFLAPLGDEIRQKTLGSSAPALIHSDSDLVKRAIRDIYHKDIEEVLVEGDEGYKAAKQFMKLLMPSHARQIGRASCRERVCQYVSISVVAVALNKKKTRLISNEIPQTTQI